MRHAVGTVLCLLVALCPFAVRAQADLAVNGGLNTELAPWWGVKIGPNGPVAAPELIARETSDTWNGTSGALRLSLQRQAGFQYYSHNSGAVATLNQVIPSSTPIRVQFSAKSISGGSWLTISRLWGGGHENVQIGPTWRRHEVYVWINQETSALLFNVVNGDSENLQVLANSEVLLDELVVTVAPFGTANLMGNSHFEANTQNWYGQKQSATGLVAAPEMIQRVAGDTPNGSSGALRLGVTRDSQSTYPNHVAGAVGNFHTTVPAGSMLRVRFWAKRVSGSYSWVSVARVWGGAIANVPITDTWQRHEVLLPLLHDTGSLVFGIVPGNINNIQELSNGVALLDDVDVRFASPIAAASLPPGVVTDIPGYSPGDIGCEPALVLAGPGTNPQGQPTWSSVSYVPPGTPGCHVPASFCDANDNPVALPSEAALNAAPAATSQCGVMGDRAGTDCAVDPTTITSACSSNADCAAGFVCGQACLNAACTSVGLRCGRLFESCAGLSAEPANCEDQVLYECPDLQRDIGTVPAASVAAQLPEQSTPIATASIPPAEQLQLPLVRPATGNFCSEAPLEGDDMVTQQGNAKSAAQGNDKWGAFLEPISDAKVNFKPVKFFGSGEFEVSGEYGLSAGVKVFGKEIIVLGASARAGVAHCGVGIGAAFKVFGDDVWTWEAVSVPAGVNLLAGETPSAQRQLCMAKLDELGESAHALRKSLFAAQNAVAFYKEHGMNGRMCQSARAQLDMPTLDCTTNAQGLVADTTARAIVQQVLRDYDLKAQAVRDVDASYDLAKGQVSIDAQLPLFKIRPKPYTVQLFRSTMAVGPVILTLVAEGYGQYGVVGSVAVGLSYQGSLAQGQLELPSASNTKDVRALAGPVVTPEFGIGAGVFAGAGIPGVAVGIEGRINLFTLQLPVEARVGIARVSSPDPRDFSLHYPGAAKPGFANTAYKWQTGYTFGAKARISLLDGRINLAARINLLFFKKTFRKKIVDWKGISREYKLFGTSGGSPLTDKPTLGDTADDVAYPEVAMPPPSIPTNPDPNAMMDTPLGDWPCGPDPI